MTDISYHGNLPYIITSNTKNKMNLL